MIVMVLVKCFEYYLLICDTSDHVSNKDVYF